MQTLKNQLINKFKGAKRLAILGIGSELICDDAAGMLAAKQLDSGPSLNKNMPCRVFFGATSPESLTGEIKRFKPTDILIIDAADFNATPGTTRFIELEDIGGVSFSTHRLPTKILTDYLIKSLNCRIAVVGIQPKSLDFCAAVSPEIKKAVDELVFAIKEAIECLTPP